MPALRRLLPRPALLCGILISTIAPTAHASRSQHGFAALDTPDAHRPYISGPVWSLALSRDGALFVGSTRLAVYHGSGWQSIEVPGTVRMLSLASDPTDNDRMWFGAEGGIGFLQRNPHGEWKPTSLEPELAAAGLQETNDVRFILPDAKGGAWFVSRSKVLRWDGSQFRHWVLPNPNRLWSFLHQGILHVHQSGVGVFRIDEDGPKLWRKESDLPAQQPMIGLLDTPEGELAVFYEDIYRRVDGAWMQLPAVAALLRGRRAMHVVRIDADTIAVGTAYGGVFLLNNDGSLRGAVTGQFGLPDDSVDVLLAGDEGQLWIGTGTGLVRLIGAGRVSVFDQRARLAHGFVRRVVEHEGKCYVVTSRRAYELIAAPRTEPAHFFRIETLWPQLRDAAVQGGELWLGGTGGLWRIQNREALREPGFEGNLFAILSPRMRPDLLVGFDSVRAHALHSIEGRRRWSSLQQQVESAPLELAEDGRGRIWVATRDGHVHVFRWAEEALRLDLEHHFSPGRDLPAGTRHPQLAVLDGEIFVFTETDVFRCIEPEQGFVPVPELDGFVVDAVVSRSDGSAYWSVQHRRIGPTGPRGLLHVVRNENGRIMWTPLAAPGYDHISDVTSLSITRSDGDAALWVGGENALVRIGLDALAPAPPPPPARLLHVQAEGVSLPLLARAPATLAADTNRIAFAFAAPVTTTGAPWFQTRLRGVEKDWSAPESISHREFTGLASGDYTFEVRAIDRFGRGGPAATFAFSLPPPWYHSAPALVAWLLLLAAAISLSVRWRLHALQRQAGRLNELVNERTRELSLSNTAKTELLESLSHEIRRPLNGILALITRLDDGSFNPTQRESAQQLQRASESLSRTCDDLLNFSQLDYGILQLEERPFSVQAMIRHVLAVHDAQDRIVVNFAAGFRDSLHGDELKLETIVGNFVANALKYAAGKPIEIHVEATIESPHIVEVLIEVTDGGPGIPGEEQELIFRRFVRGSQAKKSGVPGTGIGLATCRGMARLLGGSVGVESPSERAGEMNLGHPGTTFFVRVPLRRLPE